MKTTREEALAFLAEPPKKPQEQFNQAFALYRNSPGKLETQERFLNRVGYSATTLATVLYELQKLHKISDSEIRKVGKPVELPPVVENTELKEHVLTLVSGLSDITRNTLLTSLKLMGIYGSKDNVPTELNAFVDKTFEDLSTELEGKDDWNNLATVDNYNAIKEILAEQIDAVEFPEEVNDIIKAQEAQVGAINEINDKLSTKAVEAFKEATTDIKQEIKFRDEFPFLSDPDLPIEMKVLVTEKFNHYFDFVAAHKELFVKMVPGANSEPEAVPLTDVEVFDLAKQAVENFEMDQLIYDELVHYRENKKILGAHPIFKMKRLRDSIDAMTSLDASKRLANLANYINRDTKKAESAKTPEDKKKYEDKVLEWEAEKVLVNARLDDAKK